MSDGTLADVPVALDEQAAVTALGTATVGISAGVVSGVSVASYAGAGGALGVGVLTAVGSAWLGTRVLWSRIARRWAREVEVLTQTASEPPDEPITP